MLDPKQLSQAAEVIISRHRSEIESLSKVMNDSGVTDLIPMLPHFSIVLYGRFTKKAMKQKEGIRLILVNKKKAIGTTDFKWKEKELHWAHSTFGKEAAITLKVLKKLYRAG